MNELTSNQQEFIQTISEEELLARIAWFYYHDNLTQSEIGVKITAFKSLQTAGERSAIRHYQSAN